MSDIKKLVIPVEFFVDLLKKSTSEFIETFNIDDGEEAFVLNADSLETLKSWGQSRLDEVFAGGKAEERGKDKRVLFRSKEKELAKLFDLDISVNLSDIEAFKSAVDLKYSHNSLDPLKIENSKTYLNKVKELEKEINSLTEKLENQSKHHTFLATTAQAEKELRSIEGLDFKDPLLVSMVLDRAWKEKFRPTPDKETGKLLMADSEGEFLRQGSEPVTWKTHAKEKYGKLFAPQKTTSKTPGSGGSGGDPKLKYRFDNPEEAMKAFNRAETPEEKAAVKAAIREMEK